MSHLSIKKRRQLLQFTQEEMAEFLNISQNAYCLVENGKTRLMDIDRINKLCIKLESSPGELGIFDGLSINQNFVDKVENGYINNLVIENKELFEILKMELETKNKIIEKLLANAKKE